MNKDDVIGNVYLFRGISADDFSALSKIVEQMVFLPGDLVYDVGQVSDAIIIIQMGTVDIVIKGKQAPVVTMGTGQTLGELAFFQPGKRFATATARERTQVARIPFDKLTELLTERATLALLFYRNACTFLAKHVQELASERDRRYF